MPLVTVQGFLKSILDGLAMPYGIPAAQAFITPPDPRIRARIPAVYVWPSDGQENRSAKLGGTIPRNTGPGTPAGTKGILHQFDVYITWMSSGHGPSQDAKFPGVVDAVMAALRTCQPNPAYLTDPVTGITTTVYNAGEQMRYRVGVEALEDERWLRYDCLVQCSVWEILSA